MGREKKFKLYYYTGGLLTTDPQDPLSKIFIGVSEDFIKALVDSKLFDKNKVIRKRGNLIFDEKNRYKHDVVYCCKENRASAKGAGQIHANVTSVEKIKGEYKNDISKLYKILAQNNNLEDSLRSTFYALLYIGICAAFERFVLSIVTYFLYEDKERLRSSLNKIAESDDKSLRRVRAKSEEPFEVSCFRLWYAIRTMDITSETVKVAMDFIAGTQTLICPYNNFKERRNNLVHRNGILQTSTYKADIVSKNTLNYLRRKMGLYVDEISEVLSKLPHPHKGLESLY